MISTHARYLWRIPWSHMEEYLGLTNCFLSAIRRSNASTLNICASSWLSMNAIFRWNLRRSPRQLLIMLLEDSISVNSE